MKEDNADHVYYTTQKRKWIFVGINCTVNGLMVSVKRIVLAFSAEVCRIMLRSLLKNM